jgi:hypothetical protein
MPPLSRAGIGLGARLKADDRALGFPEADISDDPFLCLGLRTPDKSAKPVERTVLVFGRHVALEVKLVEQRLLHYRPLAHHRRVPLCLEGLNQDFTPTATTTLSTKSEMTDTLCY